LIRALTAGWVTRSASEAAEGADGQKGLDLPDLHEGSLSKLFISPIKTLS
jgi:hypothetical protein